jgi:hypothetical protein
MRFSRFVILLCCSIGSIAAPRRAGAAPSEAPPPPDAPSAETNARFPGDPLYPGKHHASIALATGVPFVAMGEVAYAPTEHFAIGGLVGATPFVLGLGLRPRVSIPMNERTRLGFVTTLLYYPTGEGLIGDGPPWFLAQPSLRIERRIGDRGYVDVGAGVVAALGVPAKNERGEMVVTYGDKRFVGHELPWGVWNTVGAGGAFAVSEHTVVFAEAMLVLRGVEVPSEWIGGPPVAFTLGIARVL